MIDVGPYIRQGQLPWGPVRLGDGKRTIAQSGCLLSCLTMAARALTPNKNLTVLGAQQMIDEIDGFVGSSLKVPSACKALGVRLISRATMRPDAVRTDLELDRPVILGVDYKPGASSGFSDVDHWLLAIEMEGTVVHFIDPATGTLDELDLAAPIYRKKQADVQEMIRLAPMMQ
jgi:hypothetical protein